MHNRHEVRDILLGFVMNEQPIWDKWQLFGINSNDFAEKRVPLQRITNIEDEGDAPRMQMPHAIV